MSHKFALKQKIQHIYFCLDFQLLRCDRRTIIAHVGGEFLLTCTFENSFYFNKKYWCRGASRDSCEILADSEGVARTKYTHRSHVVDYQKRVFVKVTNLQIDDSGEYWVGIDKVYSDIMVSVTLHVTQGNLAIDTSAGLQLWYSVLRWGLFASLLIFLCVFLRCIRTRNLQNNIRIRTFYSRTDA
uniref:Immunoglobulin V-set domain-containing protein n=1 Tax=Oryzias melastigma TaxID=30732 RepID=A0A3B3CL25_ORYME